MNLQPFVKHHPSFPIHFPSPMRLFGLQLPAQSFLQQSSGTWPEMEMDFQQKPQDGNPQDS